MSKKIILTIGGTDISFEPTMTAYNGFINDMMPNDKVAPAHNYLKKIVSQDPVSRPALDELLKQPGAALQLAGAINQQFAPDLEITVKN
ncbi:putative phage tail assembly chaperone [Aeromonas sanarellii]